MAVISLPLDKQFFKRVCCGIFLTFNIPALFPSSLRQSVLLYVRVHTLETLTSALLLIIVCLCKLSQDRVCCWIGYTRVEKYTPLILLFPEKLTSPQLIKNLPAFYGSQMFITAFTRARHMSLRWARSIQSMLLSHFLKIHFNIILPSTPTFFKRSPLARFSHQIPVRRRHNRNKICENINLQRNKAKLDW
jgi:hypothetical protein